MLQNALKLTAILKFKIYSDSCLIKLYYTRSASDLYGWKRDVLMQSVLGGSAIEHALVAAAMRKRDGVARRLHFRKSGLATTIAERRLYQLWTDMTLLI